MTDLTGEHHQDKCVSMQEQFFNALKKLVDVSDVKADVKRIENDVKELRDMHLSLEKTVSTALVDINSKMGVLIAHKIEMQPYIEKAKTGKAWFNNFCYVVTGICILAFLIKMPIKDIFTAVLSAALKV